MPLIWLVGYSVAVVLTAFVWYHVGRRVAQRRQIDVQVDILTAKWQAEDQETLHAWGPRMANAEHRLDQAYDMISAMLWLQHQHWPLTLEQKKELLPEMMHVTFTRVEEWKEKQTEAVKY